jgi:hypothetical protein
MVTCGALDPTELFIKQPVFCPKKHYAPIFTITLRKYVL